MRTVFQRNRSSVYFVAIILFVVFIWNNGLESTLNSTSKTVINESLNYEFEITHGWQAQNFRLNSQSNGLITKLSRIFHPPQEIEIYFAQQSDSDNLDFDQVKNWMDDILKNKNGVWENDFSDYQINGFVGFKRKFDTPKFRGLMIYVPNESQNFIFLVKFNSRNEHDATEIVLNLIQSFSTFKN